MTALLALAALFALAIAAGFAVAWIIPRIAVDSDDVWPVLVDEEGRR